MRVVIEVSYNNETVKTETVIVNPDGDMSFSDIIVEVADQAYLLALAYAEAVCLETYGLRNNTLVGELLQNIDYSWKLEE